MIALCLDASTYDGSVAVVADGRLLAATGARMKGAARETLMPAVAGALAAAGLSNWRRELDGVVCGAGPGSFTSLRIAASLAKGIAVALERPLYAVSSLALMVAAAVDRLDAGSYLAVLDALRGEVYAARFEVSAPGVVVETGPARLVAIGDLDRLASDAGARLLGPGRTIDVAPSAVGVLRLAARLEAAGPVDVAAWEPAYGRLAEAQVRWEAAHGRPLPPA